MLTVHLLARWASDAILRYAAETPLEALTPTHRRAVAGADLGTAAAEILAENPSIYRVRARLMVDPLERLPCDGLVLQRPARCPAAGRSEAENRRKIDLPAEARNVPSRPLMNVTITG